MNFQETNAAVSQEIAQSRTEPQTPAQRTALQNKVVVLRAWSSLMQLKMADGAELADFLASPEFAWLKGL